MAIAVVSVVIPTRNRAAMLQRAVQSVLAQTYPHLEVVIVDDASNDETKNVVRVFQDSRVRYIRHEVNRGGSAARNTGVCSATGEYIAFLDDDDEWEAQKIEMQLASIGGYDAVMCTASLNGRSVLQRRPRPAVEPDVLRKRMFPYGGTGVLLARARVLREIPFDETLPKYQDWDLVIRIAARYRIAYLNMALVRFNEGSHERISNQLVRMSAQDMIRKYRGFFDKHKDFFGKRWIAFHFASMLLYGIRHRRSKVRYLQEVIRFCGGIAVVGVLAKRVRQLIAERIPRRPASRQEVGSYFAIGPLASVRPPAIFKKH